MIAVKQYGNPLEGLAEAVKRAEGRSDDFASATRSLAELHNFAEDCLIYEGNIPPPDLCKRIVRQAVRVSEGHVCGPVVELALQVLGKKEMLDATGEPEGGWLYQRVGIGRGCEVKHMLCTREHLDAVERAMAMTA